MYFVDRKKIEEILLYMEKVLAELEGKSFETALEKFSQERMAHVLIEAILDVGNMMIDGFIMRDPGSYDDIIDILIDEKVLPAEEEADYKEFISLRKMLVNNYMNVDYAHLEKVIKDKKKTLEHFSSHINTYLTNELGVANAFSNR
ncbi:DUF86 domain-containing protein [Oceanobacillus halophilus]|uniref:DUF86 domain-containing protein n=1 Tax=Oceanobacillus halophilus TaxID=930130 RepID=A0A494ZU49_9BACI|nr:HepT-like ribonuclease domain-containing protein [Oceanobacillus halophilus]RKQ29601.1 DUF86 domain-containing protein [Oceanobacillus halophilus]